MCIEYILFPKAQFLYWSTTPIIHIQNNFSISLDFSFAKARRTFVAHHDTIINCFNGRSTNTAAVSHNDKIKNFIRQFRGVTDVKFFLYRLCKIYA
ncbi:transposase [Carboxylicivirga sp. RSCT41]|uniref:transposase n=1 Tax=Carboxylicivirga agarovorans TaxID=3417570 RepID=UPI003D344F64